MSGPNGSPTPASTVDFTNIENPIGTSPTLQCGSWNYVGIPPHSVYVGIPAAAILEGVPAQVKVSVSGSGVIQVGAPNQFSCRASLASHTLQLTAHIHDAQNNLTDPPLGTFVWISRQRLVATVDVNGLVTLVGRGSCTLEARYSRSANLPFLNASPSPTEAMAIYATVDLVVIA
jgi:hypothetical protein